MADVAKVSVVEQRALAASCNAMQCAYEARSLEGSGVPAHRFARNREPAGRIWRFQVLAMSYEQHHPLAYFAEVQTFLGDWSNDV